MPSPKHLVLGIAEDMEFPLDKTRLLDRLDELHVEPDVVLMVHTIDDDRFSGFDELAHRLDEALGVPDAAVGRSVLAADPDWEPSFE